MSAQALVVGASGGIGRALAKALESRDYEVTRLSRSQDGLDVTSDNSIATHLDGLAGPFDLIIVATGALTSTTRTPEKSLQDLGREELLAQFELNAVGPALVLKQAQRLLPRKQRSVFAVLSARVGSIGDNRMGGWYAYRTSKAALNALIYGAAVELKRSRPQAVLACLHPGTVATRFTEDYPNHNKVSPEMAAARLLDVMAHLTATQSGGFFDYAGREIPW